MNSASLLVWHATYLRAAVIVGGVRRPMIMVSVSKDGALLTGNHTFAHGEMARLELEHHLGTGAMHADVEVHDPTPGRQERERLVQGLSVRFVGMTAEMGAYIDAECARPQRGVAVVDDNSTQLWHLQAMLSGLGFRVVGIANPIGATNIIARADVQQVLISLEMTGLDGGNLCRLLRHHPRTRALSIMLHSLGSDEGLAAAAQAAGADGHVRADANTANLAQKLLLGARDGRAASSVAVPAAAVAASLPRLVEASLGPAANPPHEKRRERRLTFLASCQLTELASGAALTGYTANLSRGGVALYLSRRLAYGSSVRLGLHDDGPGRREIIGTVRWVRPFDPFFATGISFNLSEEPARRTVGALIDGIDAS